MVNFGLYSADVTRRPKTYPMSLLKFVMGCGALLLLPFFILEFSADFTLKPDALAISTPLLLSTAIIRQDFSAFVWHAFKRTHGESLGNQAYVRYLCYEISKFIEGY